MSKANELSRRSLRTDRVIELSLAPWPDPPPNMMKLPGVSEWWAQMKLARERDIQSLHGLAVRYQIQTTDG
jgi:hypothetical protein